MDKHRKEVEGPFSKSYLLEYNDVFQEEGAIGDFRSQGVSALIQQTNKALKDKIWGSKEEQMKETFGEYIESAKEDMNKFKR